jgi:hypothetical protein
MSPTNKKKHGKSKTATTSTSELSPPDMTSPTRVMFRDFIELADIDTINIFLAATTATSESENLELLWKRAYKEGFENGQKTIQPTLQRVGKKLEERFEKGVAKGMDLGREEGYTIAKEAFDNMVMQLKTRDAPKINTNDTSTQTDPPTTATASISVQTNPTMFAATSQSPTLSEIAKKSENLLDYSEISPKFAVFLPQTPSVAVLDPLESTTITTVLKMQSTTADFTENYQNSENSPIFVKKTPEPLVSRHFNWADDASTLPIALSLPYPPRDLSALRSSSPKPFSSLRRRNKRSQTHYSPPFCNQPPFTIRHRALPSRFFTTQFQPTQYHNYTHHFLPSSADSALNWESDPRLSDLSRSLKALGWIRTPSL